MSNVVRIDPFRCRMWPLHDRLRDHITLESCRVEIDSFRRHGQLVPALGRVLQDDPSADAELIYGARRLFIARHLEIPLLVELRELSDREAIVAMDIENRHRVDISPYERGLSFSRWVRSGYFASQDELANALQVSASQVSRLLKLARLPSAIVAAFRNPAEICEGWGLEISEVLDDPLRRAATLRKARAIAADARRPSPMDVYRQLVAPLGQARRASRRGRDQVIKGEQGVPLFRVRHRSDSIALLLPAQDVSERSLENVREVLTQILRRASPQAPRARRRKSPTR